MSCHVHNILTWEVGCCKRHVLTNSISDALSVLDILLEEVESFGYIWSGCMVWRGHQIIIHKYFSCEFFLTVDKQWFRQVSVISAEIKKVKNKETLPKSSDVHIPLYYFLDDERLHQLIFVSMLMPLVTGHVDELMIAM